MLDSMRCIRIVSTLALLALPVHAGEPADLFAAARAGDAGEVARLLEAGVPIDSVDRYGASALLMAASRGHLEVIELLLDRGADADRAETFYGSRPVDAALFNSHPEAATKLLEHGAAGREGALGFALRQGDLELATAVVEAGPIRQSVLDRMRALPTLTDEAREILSKAEARPDPEPPTYDATELVAFEGIFEGWASGSRVEAAVTDGQLTLAIDAAEPRAVTAVGDKAFRLGDGDAAIEAGFFGRAGTIEGLVLRRPGAQPEMLRHSVAEPVDLAALAEHLANVGDHSPGEPTVHWPSFRGTNASGIGDGEDTPVEWDLETGAAVRWQVEVPGLGNSSPVVWGDKVIVTTAFAAEADQEIRTGLTGDGTSVDEAVEHSWQVMAYDKDTGELLWSTEVARGVPLTSRHFKATQANSTVATDGRYVVAVFPTAGFAALDMDGKLLWKHELGGLNAGAFTDPAIEWGYASSPFIYRDTAILQVDVHEDGYLAAWDLETGERKWRTERDVAPSWATPSLLPGHDDRGDELVVNGSTIHGYDPATGEELWSLGPNSELVIATPVIGDGVAYVSAGYPPVKPIYAIRAGTRGALEVEPGEPHGRLVWSHNRGGAYMPTPLLYRGLFYVVHHNGRMVAYEPRTGHPVLKSRFSKGGTFTGSPVAVNGKIYAPTEEGLMYVLAAGPEYRELAINDFGEPLMATPAVSEGTLLVRTPSRLIALANTAGG